MTVGNNCGTRSTHDSLSQIHLMFNLCVLVLFNMLFVGNVVHCAVCCNSAWCVRATAPTVFARVLTCCRFFSPDSTALSGTLQVRPRCAPVRFTSISSSTQVARERRIRCRFAKLSMHTEGAECRSLRRALHLKQRNLSRIAELLYPFQPSFNNRPRMRTCRSTFHKRSLDVMVWEHHSSHNPRTCNRCHWQPLSQ